MSNRPVRAGALIGLCILGVVTTVVVRKAIEPGQRQPRAGTPAVASSAPPKRTANEQTTSHGPAVAQSSALTTLIKKAAAGGASVSAYNTVTGQSVSAGDSSGMLTASVAKVELLETLLLEHERSHTTLSDYDADEATLMIENSDNDAANAIFAVDGGRTEVQSYETALGLSRSTTILGPSNLWGLSTTSAHQQIVLLDNLESSSSPLDAKSRAYALGLMSHVEADQRWGVPVAADPHTTYDVKNGWLSVSADDDLWAVNSDGIITVDGQRLLVSVMTQHDNDFDDGIAYNESLVRAVVAAVSKS